MTDTKISVNFACQRCLHPLNLDESFNYLGEHTLASLILPIHSNPDIDIESQASSLDLFVPPFRLTEYENGASGFMLISDGGTESLNHQMRVRANLFDTLSSYSNFDHPLCDECTDTLLELLEHQLKVTESDWVDYKEYLKKLENETNEPSIEALERELEDYRNEEQRLLNELEALQSEVKATTEALEEQKLEQKRLKEEEEKYWREYTKHRRYVMLTEDDYKSLECQLHYAQQQLDKLKKTNVFNATFHIWHSGHFGTINNFRLGRLPSAPVDWSEINAAWGQTALLLNALARKMNLTFEKYKVVPYGNHSYIYVYADHRELPLFGVGGFRYMWSTKFDDAMNAFLDCLQQFKEEVEKEDPGFCLPYKIRMDKNNPEKSGKIEDSANGNCYFIKIQFNSEEQWTKALKFLLTNLKWGLAWVSSQFDSIEDESGPQQIAPTTSAPTTTSTPNR
ncbi:beclin-1-like protein isoform X2 [Chrysoperla carnea]|uniref:beclin-1-like protein isoform X2 n=1 Tax=Chrysoperla carnea TaxID=189513 RepID=UPI001D06F76C|nr:beclin-1-like protein isoform X2 [Chrysoperla carnea]